MKELIYQEKGDFIFWKIDEEYSILILLHKKRKKEKEHKLTPAEKDLYFARGINYIKQLVEKYGK